MKVNKFKLITLPIYVLGVVYGYFRRGFTDGIHHGADIAYKHDVGRGILE